MSKPRKTLHIKPAAGLLVRKGPGLPLLQEDGEVVLDTTYWRRRLRYKEVELVKKAPAKTPKNQAPKKAVEKDSE